MTRIAFLGTGLLGSGFVHGLLERGDIVAAWNRTAAKAEPLAARGARIAASPADAVAGAERVHLCLAADGAVDEVLEQLLPALPPGAVVVDHSTTSPSGTAARGARLAARGVAFLHAPVFMSPQAAKAAQGMMMVAGPKALYERVEAGLRAMTGDLWYHGEDLQRAAAFKLFGNAMLIAIAGGLADVFAMARGLGIAPEEAHSLFSRFKPGGAIELRGARMARGDFAPSFELSMARKDVALMVECAAGEPMAILPALLRRCDELIAAGYGRDDLGVLALAPPRG
jgi:3-hydroxyisobutyrate dehydrogenase-like beta-hydroxyacid dehydrogenase